MPREVRTVSDGQSVEDLKRDLAEAREQQAATAKLLRMISGSTIDAQRIFAEIATTAAHLCNADDAMIFQVDGDVFRTVAHQGSIPLSKPLGQHTLPMTRESVTGRAVLDRQTIQVPDLQTLGDEYPEGTGRARRLGYRTVLAVPLIRAGEAIGAVAIRRAEVRPFTDRQIQLLSTFADQAVIAIENLRLFEAEQASKRELTEALEQQTATADVLKVISRSALDVQRVLDALVESAARLCNAYDAAIYQVDGSSLRLVAHHGNIPFPAPIGQHKRPLVRGFIAGRAVIERRTNHIADMQAEAEDYAEGREVALRLGWRTGLSVPLLRAGEAIGVILLRRREVRPFTNRQIELLKTFADQAVIAIENSRLFEEVQTRTHDLQEALEHQTATGEVLGVISRSPTDVQPVFDMIAQSAARVCNAQHCNVFRFDGHLLHFAASHGLSYEAQEMMRRRSPIPAGRGSAAGRAIDDNEVAEIQDIPSDVGYQQGDIAKVGDYRSAIAVPMRKGGQPIGAIALTRRETGPFPQRQIELLKTFADQAVIAIENARLFEEIARKSRELEIASQHKSQFVANMSHELRTPLAAILGYAELIHEGFYEPQGPKSLDALTRICSNGKHLLGLINTVLDIAKIESGQFTLNMTEYAIESVVETVRAATESLAQNKKLTLTTSVDKSLPVGLGDEQRLTQVLLNLVGNAIKFTDAGEVSIAAGVRNGHFTVSVTDTGPGIPLDQQGRIFDQFHQVDSSLTKAKGGTGLGLAIAKQIVEMHGGRIWVESTLGKGSTFQMEIPARPK